MRNLSAAFFALCLCLLPACTGGSAPPSGTGTSTASTDPTTPGAESGADGRVGDGENAVGGSAVCGEYLACIAKRSPEMLGVVTDAYGKAGSCWAEMSAEACEEACAAGKTKAKCGVCDPALGSCLGEACAPNKRCATGEVCAKGTCIEDAIERCGPSDNGSDCPAPYLCAGAGEGYACLLPCAADVDCPSGYLCYESDGVCWI